MSDKPEEKGMSIRGFVGLVLLGGFVLWAMVHSGTSGSSSSYSAPSIHAQTMHQCITGYDQLGNRLGKDAFDKYGMCTLAIQDERNGTHPLKSK